MSPTPKISPALKKRAAQIKLLLMDVDGTMTDGGVLLLSQPDGSALEIKKFDAHDGQGLTLAHTAGIQTGCITGRESPALLRRAREMKMDYVYMKIPLKMPAYEEILAKSGLKDAEVAYVGDDLPDIPLLKRVGLAVAVGDAVIDVKKSPTTPPKHTPEKAPFAKPSSSSSNPRASGTNLSTKPAPNATFPATRSWRGDLR